MGFILNYGERARRMLAFFADAQEGRTPALWTFPAPRLMTPPQPWWRRVWAATRPRRGDPISERDSSAPAE